MADRRRTPWIRLDADLMGQDLTDGIIEHFGSPGVVAWVAFQCACKRSLVQGQIRYTSEADGIALLGMQGMKLRNEDDVEWTLDDLWTYLGRMKQTTRRQSRRCTDVTWTRFTETQENARRDAQAEQKARSRAGITETKPGRNGDDPRPDRDRDRDRDTTGEVIAPPALQGELVPVSTEVAQSRPRDLVWDALMESCGIDIDGIPRGKRGAYGRAVKDIRSVQNGASDAELAAEVHRRAANYRTRWSPDMLTPMALASHWAEVDKAPMSHIVKDAAGAEAWLAGKTRQRREGQPR